MSNQFWSENLLRAYPLRADDANTVPFGAFADIVVRLSSKLNLDGTAANHIEFGTLQALVTGFRLTLFIIVDGVYSYVLQADIPLVPTLFQRVLLSVYETGGTPRPELGYGWVILGDPVFWTTTPAVLTTVFVPPTFWMMTVGSTATWAIPLESAAIRQIVDLNDLVIRVANVQRQGDTILAETTADDGEVTFNPKTATSVLDCYERAVTSPTGTQTKDGGETCPVGVVTEIPGTQPVQYHIVYVPTVTSLLELKSLEVLDTLPPLDPTYDALVDGGPADRVLEAGSNIDIGGSVATSRLTLTYRLGGGTGVRCERVPGYGTYLLAKDVLRTIQGVGAPDGRLVISAGTGLAVLPDPGNHRVLLLVNPSEIQRAAP